MTFHLSPPIDVSQKDMAQIFDESYAVFQLEINYRHTRPNLFDKFIYIDANYSYEPEKVNCFWHISSIGVDHYKYDMYPCSNDAANGECHFMCDINHENNFLKDINSIPCIYRASRIKWVRQIINLANINPKYANLRIWRQYNSKTKEHNLLLRYIDRHIDYVIIFNISYKGRDIYCYRLTTAFPVVLKSYKKRFDKEYSEYIKKK